MSTTFWVAVLVFGVILSTILVIIFVVRSVKSQYSGQKLIPVYYADFNWNNIVKLLSNKEIEFVEIPKFPEVRRDLALLINKEIEFGEIVKIAYQVEKNILKKVTLFDIYEGDKLEAGKKSYAVSFILQDTEKTLNDKQIDGIMNRLIKTYNEKLGATLR